MGFRAAGLLLALMLGSCAGVNQPGRFSTDGIADWQPQTFGKPTQYRVVEQDGHRALQAHSEQSASALYRPLRAPVHTGGHVDNTLGRLNEQLKAGDDFAARVYVLLSPLPLRFTPRALCYVWSSNTPAGGSWKSPYSDDVVIINLRSGDRQAGRWLSEVRNVARSESRAR